MYLWFEEMGLINEPVKTHKEQIADFKEKLQVVMQKNKLTRRRRNDNLVMRGKAV